MSAGGFGSSCSNVSEPPPPRTTDSPWVGRRPLSPLPVSNACGVLAAWVGLQHPTLKDLEGCFAMLAFRTGLEPRAAAPGLCGSSARRQDIGFPQPCKLDPGSIALHCLLAQPLIKISACTGLPLDHVRCDATHAVLDIRSCGTLLSTGLDDQLLLQKTNIAAERRMCFSKPGHLPKGKMTWANDAPLRA